MKNIVPAAAPPHTNWTPEAGGDVQKTAPVATGEHADLNMTPYLVETLEDVPLPMLIVLVIFSFCPQFIRIVPPDAGRAAMALLITAVSSVAPDVSVTKSARLTISDSFACMVRAIAPVPG